jgi:hypothetical protein
VAQPTDLDDDKVACGNCGDLVYCLSARFWCDGCEEEDDPVSVFAGALPGALFMAPVGTLPPGARMPASCLYRQCGTCKHPVQIVNGVIRAPGGATLTKETAERSLTEVTWVTMHAAGCADGWHKIGTVLSFEITRGDPQ